MAASDHTPDQRTADALATLFKTRELLNNLDRNALSDSAQSRVLNAEEQLDDVVLNLSYTDLQAGVSSVETPFQGETLQHTSDDTDDFPSETPDDVVKQRHAAADPEESVPLTIEVAPPLFELIDIARTDDTTFAEWVTQTIECELARYDSELWSSVTESVEISPPPEVEQWVAAWAAYHASGDVSEADIETELLNYLDLNVEWCPGDSSREE